MSVQQSFARMQHTRPSRHLGSRILKGLCYASMLLTVGTLLLIVGYILVQGVPHLKPSLFEIDYNSDNVSMFHAIINTVMMTALALIIAVPVGVFGGIYLAEYALHPQPRRKSRCA